MSRWQLCQGHRVRAEQRTCPVQHLRQARHSERRLLEHRDARRALLQLRQLL